MSRFHSSEFTNPKGIGSLPEGGSQRFSQEGISLDDGDSRSISTNSSVDTNRKIQDQETERREGSSLPLESSPVSRNEPAKRGEVLDTGDATMMRTFRSCECK